MIRSVLIARGAFAQIYEPAWMRALNELGVHASLFDAHRLTLPGLFGRVERRLLWGPGIRRINRALLEQVERERPEVVLLYQGHYFLAATVRALQKWSFVVGYHNDDPFGERRTLLRYRHLLPALCAYQGFHVYRAENLAEAAAHGVPRVGLLLPGFLPWLDHPRTPGAEWESEVVFAGHVEPDERVACLVGAVRAGIRLRIYGGERFWRPALPEDVLARLGPMPHLGPEAYRQALCGAKMAACFVSRRNRDQYTRRTFEIPACGVVLLAERTPWMTEHFREGVEAVFFTGAEEFVDKIRYYLRNDDARRRIASAGRERVIRAGDDIHNRMRQWLREVDGWRGSGAD
ncbi:MAG: glycosyltransferase family 1 protein [Magnetococcales bacterium]|nr:glycosyltransferase family 1 protein [Magnetococcales bacterium]